MASASRANVIKELKQIAMRRKLFTIPILLLVVVLAVAACGDAEPTAAPAAPTAPPVEVVVTATPGPAPTAGPTGTPVLVVVTATPDPNAMPGPTAAPVEVVVTATPGPTPTPAPTPEPVQVVVTATPAPATAAPAPVAANIVVVLDTLERELWLHHYGGSTMFNPRHTMNEQLAVWTPGYTENQLAESWELSGDSTVLTMKLRQNIPFHDGDMFVAEDVVRAYSLLYEEEASHAGLSTISPLFGDTKESLLEHVRAIDDNTVEMRSEIPYGQWVGTIIGPTSAPFHVVNSSYLDAVGTDEAAANPVGTGPFEFDEHKRGESIRVRAVENHWRQTPSVATVEFLIVPQYATQLALIASGRADIMSISTAQLAQARNVGAQLKVDESGYNVWYALRGQIPPEHDNYDGSLPWVDGDDPERAKKVRLALNLAINRQEIIDNLYGGFGTPSALGACTFPVHTQWAGTAEPYGYDLDQAKALLAEAGYADGFDISIPLYDQASGPVGEVLHEAVADSWRQLGLNVSTVPGEWTNFREILINITDPELTYYWYCNFSDPDPMRYYNFFYHTSRPLWFGSDELEVRLDAANAALLPEDREGPITAINQYMYDGHYWIPMFVLPKLYAISERVDNWPLIPGHLRVHNLEFLTVKQ